jgi:RNA polymerase sigma factor (sigma-70 family)
MRKIAALRGAACFSRRTFAPLPDAVFEQQSKVNDGIKSLPATLMGVDELSFEQLVDSYYESLFRFALSLTRHEADALDITQQTFYRWATKGGQLRNFAKVKSWLFTTLHREFLAIRRHQGRYPHLELSEVEEEKLAPTPFSVANKMDGESLMQALYQIDELYRAPLVLFYLENHSYREIAEVLDLPGGTVMSRLSRGKEILRQVISRGMAPGKIVPLGSAGTGEQA